MALIWSTVLAIAAYFLKNEILDPLRAFRAVRWKIATSLVVHENVLANTNMSTPEAKADIRRLAAELKAQYKQIPLIPLVAGQQTLYSPETVDRCVALLIGLSNSNRGDENRERIAEIRSELKII